MTHRLPWVWGATDAEVRATYPSEMFVAPGAARVIRAVDTTADAATTYAWLCQIRRAPYSYDLLDNLGRQSPRTLDPTLVDLKIGQTFSRIFSLVDFVTDESITLVTKPGRASTLFGRLAMTYAWRPGESSNRLIGVIDLPVTGRITPSARRWLLAWGDLPMMRKQLLVLSSLAEGGYYSGSSERRRR